MLWLLTTTGAAVLGALATSYIDRPTPTASITGVDISQRYNDLFGKNQIIDIPLNASLFRHLNESMWNAPFRERSANLSVITKMLLDNQEKINRLVKDLDNFQETLPTLHNLLYVAPNSVVAETFFDKWEPLDGFITAAIMGDIVRGTFVSPKSKDHNGKTSYLMIREAPGTAGATEEPVTLYIVARRGGRSTAFAVPRYKQNEEDAHALSVALAYFDQDILRNYVDAAAQELQSRSLYEEIQKEIKAALRGYSRWSVSVLISNSGSRPLSFSPHASLYINAAGTHLGNSYRVVNLVSIDGGGEPSATILDGGESKLVSFVSEKIVSSDDSWQSLLDLYDTMSRGCFVILHPESQFWNKNTNLASTLAAFGPANAGQRLNDKEIAEHFR